MKKEQIPNVLTVGRILFIPLFILILTLGHSQGSHLLAAIIFAVASITDYLDGYLARKLKQTTRFGAFLDPVADKVMVITALVLIVEYQNSFWITIPAIIMISREIIISALREWMAELGERNKVAVSWMGKVKTTSQMLALGGLLWRYNVYMETLAIVLLYLAAILTVWSMLQYLKAAKGSLLDNIEL